MSPCLEFEGKNVDKAVEIACAELKIPKERLKYDIVSYGSSGIFGLVAVKKAKIKVTLNENQAVREDENKNGSDRDTPCAAECAPQEDSAIEEDEEKSALPEETVELGKTALKKILDFITTDTEISVSEDNERLLFDVRGGNSAVLIGKRGQTLDAIQYLVEKIMNKSCERRVRVQVDVEGYLDNRQNRLRDLASRLAQKAKRNGKPVTVGQLNSHDRRIIHLALRNDNSVRTQSMGDGPFRKLVIFPKNKQKKRRPPKTNRNAD